MNYMRRKSEYYYKLRDTWKAGVKNGCMATGELAYVTSMVKKDVLRTDHLHPFYASNDDDQNIASLFNILTTYALNHPSVSYCQGMSDIASPLLVTMNDEAQAYICFWAIMSRVKETITEKPYLENTYDFNTALSPLRLIIVFFHCQTVEAQMTNYRPSMK
ncbi:hypothetical protein GQX74_014230 [Glossina fuscipes]|nr:hypothetical protein GQX74_014230 [Glossina fuscipes]